MSISDAASSSAVPLLEAGDHLTRDEFERRYEAMPSGKKAELLNGVVYIPSPVRDQRHGAPHLALGGWLFAYESATPGVMGADNGTVRLGRESEPQPDLHLRILPECGGQARNDADDYVEGPPELVVEIAASSVSYDLGVKLHVYEEQGVREYIAWRVVDRAIDWFVLRNGRYERLAISADGILRSETFAGLWLDVEAMLSRNGRQILEVLQQGLASDEHKRFVKRLADVRASNG